MFSKLFAPGSNFIKPPPFRHAHAGDATYSGIIHVSLSFRKLNTVSNLAKNNYRYDNSSALTLKIRFQNSKRNIYFAEFLEKIQYGHKVRPLDTNFY